MQEQKNQILLELQEIKQLLQLNQPVFSLEQFCNFANISKAYAYKLTSTGKLKFYRPFGKKIYIDREDALEALKQHPVKASQERDKVVNNIFLTNKNVAQ